MSHGHKNKHDDINDDGNPMQAEAFRNWRRRLGLKQKDAADLLGLKKRMIQYYETGSRDGKHVSIPKSIRLACYALEMGVGDYNGERIIRNAPIVRQPDYDASRIYRKMHADALARFDNRLELGHSAKPSMPETTPSDE